MIQRTRSGIAGQVGDDLRQCRQLFRICQSTGCSPRPARRRALEANPQSPAALGAMGHVLIHADRRYAEGLEYYSRALAGHPDQAIVHQWLAIAHAHLGHTEVVLQHIRRAQSLEPRALHFASNVVLLLYFARRNDEAISQLEALLRLEPRMGFVHRFWMC